MKLFTKVIIATFLIFFLQGCRKKVFEPQAISSNPNYLSKERAVSYLKNYLSTNSNLSFNSTARGVIDTTRNFRYTESDIDYNGMRDIEFEGGDNMQIAGIGIQRESCLSYDRLLIAQHQDSIFAYIYEVIVDDSVITSFHGNSDSLKAVYNFKRFSGIINIYNLRGNLLRSFEYVNGSIVNQAVTNNCVNCLSAAAAPTPSIPICIEFPWFCGNGIPFPYVSTDPNNGGSGGGGTNPGPILGGPCSDGGGVYVPPIPADPCAAAQPGADKATVFSQTSNYTSAKNDIQAAAASDNHEHTITFGKDQSNVIRNSPITNGGSVGGNVDQNWPNAFADFHNHPDNLPPSPPDVMNIIGLNQNHLNWDTRYLVTADNNVYALLIVDFNKAVAFKNRYPLVQIGNYPPDFPDPPFSTSDNVKTYFETHNYNHQDSEALALSFILDDYNSGVALLKQDSNGNFKRLKVNASTNNLNVTTYTESNCQ